MTTPKRKRMWMLTSTLALLTVSIGVAQTAPVTKTGTDQPSSSAVTADDDETVVLSPFEVSTTAESNAYQVNDTLAGTRVRTNLNDLGTAITVISKKFMQDIGATDAQSLLQYTTNSEVGGLYGNFGGMGNNSTISENQRLLQPNTFTRVRGLAAADSTRNYFLSSIPWDNFNVDRVDMQRGPNSMLFGTGSPAGIINTSLNDASYKTAYKAQNRIDQYGSMRNSLDLNQVILDRELAIRVVGLDDNAKYRQDGTFNHQRRIYGALKYNPKLFNLEDARTEIKINTENGNVTSRNPRTLPPGDQITPWFASLNKLTVDPWVAHQTNGVAGGPTSTNFNPYIGSTRGREFWSSPLFIYNGTGGTTADTATETYVLGTANGIGRANAADHSQPTVTSWPVTGQIPGGVPFASAVGISPYSQYAKDAGLPGAQFGAYRDKLLTDSSIFNFYDKTLDGPNSFQYQHWSSINAELVQTFLNDRLGIDLAMYREHYLYGGENYLTDSNYAISVDINTVMPDHTPNPNVGRPYISTDATYGNGDSDIKRNAWRAQVFGSIKSADFTSNKVAQFIFGEHNITGIMSDDKVKTTTSQWVRWFASGDWGNTVSGNGNQSAQGSGQNVDVMSYIGGSLQNASTASGANLSGLDSLHTPGTTATIRYFDSTWKYSLNPADPTFVNPNAPYTLPIYSAPYGTLPGDPALLGNQSQNTANYVGWTTKQFQINNADAGSNKIYISGNTRTVGTQSMAFSWQGYMFDRIITPAFGWRTDRVTVAAQTAALDPDHLGYVQRPGSYDQGVVQLIDEQQSRTWSVVVHLPQFLKKKMPLGMDLSAFYDKSSNFQAQSIRRDFLGGTIPDPTGTTTEKGFVVSAFDGKLHLKVNWYDTLVKDADLPGSNPLGARAYELYLLPTWGAATAADDWAGLTNTPINGKIPPPWFWDYADGDHQTGYGTQPRPAAAAPYDAAEFAMIKAFADNTLPQSFWDVYQLPVSVANMQSGDWAHAITQTTWNADPASGGGAGALQSGSGGTVNGIAPSATVDTRSKGVEFELYAQPTKNWNITVNASKDKSTEQNLNRTMVTLISMENNLWNSAAGDLRLWSRGGQTMRSVYNADIYGPYLTMIAQTGSQVPELRPWRVNGVTSYTFDHGFLKNVSVGGAYRWEQGAILGYHLNPTTQLIDVNQPWKGTAEQNGDLWVGYSMNLIKGIKWQIQLNVRNVGRKAHLVPISVEPDGSPAMSRIADGQLWSVTNTFSF